MIKVKKPSLLSPTTLAPPGNDDERSMHGKHQSSSSGRGKDSTKLKSNFGWEIRGFEWPRWDYCRREREALVLWWTFIPALCGFKFSLYWLLKFSVQTATGVEIGQCFLCLTQIPTTMHCFHLASLAFLFYSWRIYAVDWKKKHEILSADGNRAITGRI